LWLVTSAGVLFVAGDHGVLSGKYVHFFKFYKKIMINVKIEKIEKN
jgi:hypothetical protein